MLKPWWQPMSKWWWWPLASDYSVPASGHLRSRGLLIMSDTIWHINQITKSEILFCEYWKHLKTFQDKCERTLNFIAALLWDFKFRDLCRSWMCWSGNSGELRQDPYFEFKLRHRSRSRREVSSKQQLLSLFFIFKDGHRLWVVTYAVFFVLDWVLFLHPNCVSDPDGLKL